MLERHDRRSVVNLFTHEENQQVHQAGNPPATSVKHLIFNPFSPNAIWNIDTVVGVWPVTDAALTISKITLSLNTAAHEVQGDLMYADAFIGRANPNVINDFDTTNGVRVDSSITLGAVPAGKVLYLSFDAEPNAAITQMPFDIEFTYD